MTDTRVLQGATIVSITEIPAALVMQGATIVSITEIPAALVMQGAIIFSVTAQPPRVFNPIAVNCHSPILSVTDAPRNDSSIKR